MAPILPGTGGGFPCELCGKVFARDDLRRRHTVRERRAAARPHLPRQKSCMGCARTKSRCDLSHPCGRCIKKSKDCQYPIGSWVPPGTNYGDVSEPLDGSGSLPAGAPPTSQPAILDPQAQSPSQSPFFHEPAVGPHHTNQMRWPSGLGVPIQGASLPTSTQTAPRASVDAELDPSLAAIQPPEASWTFDPSLAQPFIVDSHSLVPAVTTSTPGAAVHPSPQFLAHHSSVGTAVSGGDRPMGGSLLPVPRGPSTSPFDLPAVLVASPSEHSLGPPLRHSTHRNGSSSSRPSLAPIVTGPTTLADPPAGPLSGLLPGSGVPGFSAICHTGWLAEPVLPSPIYGADSMSAASSLLHDILNTSLTFSAPLPGGLNSPQLAELKLDQQDAGMMLPGSAGMKSRSPAPVAPSTGHTPTPAGPYPAPELAVLPQAARSAPSREAESPQALTAAVARQIWQHGIGDSYELPYNLARAAAVQLITYPALMVLPDPSSPVPPFIFRPWLAQTRAQLPESLAVCRIVLAGYLVRLPSSMGVVWRHIAERLLDLIDASPLALQSDDVNLFASTAALWLYLVLALLSDEDTAKECIDDTVIDAGLRALSDQSRALSARVREKDPHADELPMSEWGLLESMRRTLFASYVLLVLQRLRNGTESDLRATLAGAEVVLDIVLPAPAAVFTAASEAEWVAADQGAQARVQRAMGFPPGQPVQHLTLRDLVRIRRDPAKSKHDLDRIGDLFTLADEFTNIFLTVSLGLDGGAVRAG